LKISKELKTGIIAVVAIGLLISGINFLKGNSFFGGDDAYYVYLSESGGIAPATSVYVNGVVVGKVLDIKLSGEKDPKKKVLLKFNIQDRDFKIPVGSLIHSGSIDLLSKGLIIEPSDNLTAFYKINDKIQGSENGSLISDVKEYADPLIQKIQSAIGSLDKFIVSINAFWDESASSELKETFDELQVALKKFGNVANDVEGLVASEKGKLSRIFSNVESITANLQKSNEKIEGILGDAKNITDGIASADLKGTIEEAKAALNKFNAVLDSAKDGKGTLGKLIADDQLYNELNRTNQNLQNLLQDFEKHPERYIHFSIFGTKTKGVSLTPKEEKKLREMLDSTKTK
jgi:phospholipid/cholesterol/gamma-HCH transport system substrate-binding protein